MSVDNNRQIKRSQIRSKVTGANLQNRSKLLLVTTEQELKLHKSAAPWQPSHKKETKSCEEGETEELNKKLKSILNKLTPQNFQTLLQQMHGLRPTIDTEERLKGVTDLIFEHAISQPHFNVAYANMCKYLLMLKVPSHKKPGESVNFRVILLTRCQREFEQGKDDQVILDKKRKELDEAESEEQKAQLKKELEEVSSKARRRSTGNIRFIGELFKLKMLTKDVMHDCVFKLLQSRDEENLECLCQLLTTIGKELESEKAKSRMDQYFSQMQRIVREKKVSYQCRFKLLDVIELRENRWVPRRDENKPKTIKQIHREAKQEEIQRHMISQINAQQPMKRNRSPRGPSQGGQGGMGEYGWITVRSKARKRNTERNIDLSKLRINKSSDDNSPLARRWMVGGGYAALSKEDDHRSRAFGRGSSPHRGQGRMPGSFQKGRLGGHGSQELERERAIASARTIVSGRSTPPSAPASREGSRTREPRQKETEKQVEVVKEWTVDEMELKTRAIIDEYLHIQDKKEAVLCVTELRCPSMIHVFVQTAINHVLERSKPARRQTGAFLHDLIRQNLISVDTYLKGLTEILQFAEDKEIDIPKIWKYLGELIGPMIQDGSVPLSFLQQACKPLIENNKAGILVAEILHDVSQELGHKIVGDLWRSSGLQWSDFVPHQEVEQFLKDKNLEFTVGPSSQPITPISKVSFDKICDDLKEQLTQPHCDNENVFDWIEANVSEETTKDPRFIRALMTAVCSNAISVFGNMAMVDHRSIRSRRALLQKYLEHKALYELQALYALQSLVFKLDNPPRVLRTFFDTLYDEEIISEDAFNQWENSNDPAEVDGKGVALKQVVQFFAWLREGEEDENDS
ncbi:eukaryotic translation initiation factor 4 gamma 1-like [Gigantopelta aegis]|uniref:eukaryotic translation initiation factor 4 gamma 1-like n=1 Tax=Gigantopelta aegis TaxID=1735272 RepID=UPI001B8878BB|nr:eukaryotic translation initiation factor 4 gamma 1-like [Gigantopelta aegis]